MTWAETFLKARRLPRSPITGTLKPPSAFQRPFLSETAAALGVVALSVLCAELLYQLMGLSRFSPVFLAAVLIAGAWLGARAALLSAFVAFTAYVFYSIEPRFTLNLANREDALNAAVFLNVSLITGGLAGRLRDESHKAQFRADALALLYETTRRMSVSDHEDGIWEELRRAISDFCAREARACVASVSGEIDLGAETPEVASLVSLCLQQPAAIQTLRGWAGRSVEVEGAAAAVMVWPQPSERGDGLNRNTLINLVCDLAGATVSRVRLASRRAEASAMRNTERLRTALLSSISHDLRTPLSGILASASSLADYGEAFDADTRRDLALNIQGEAEALNQFVAKLLSMTRLESGALVIQPQRFRVIEVANDVVDRIEKRTGARQVTIIEAGADIEAEADPDLTAQALANVLENAIRFSPEHRPIELSIARHVGRVHIVVSDHGPGVAADERTRIFDKFYRVGGAGRGSGSGLGLSITKGLMEAMTGSASAAGRADGQPGLVVTLSLPEARP